VIITARDVRIIYAREGGFTTSREGGIITEALRQMFHLLCILLSWLEYMDEGGGNYCCEEGRDFYCSAVKI